MRRTIPEWAKKIGSKVKEENDCTQEPLPENMAALLRQLMAIELPSPWSRPVQGTNLPWQR